MRSFGWQTVSEGPRLCAEQNAVLPLPLSEAENDDFANYLVSTQPVFLAVLDITGKFFKATLN